MAGFVRQARDAEGYGRFALETGAIALERDGTRVVLCGADFVGIGEPEISRLLARVSAAASVPPEGVLLNWNHTHLAPIGGDWGGETAGPHDPERDRRIRAYADVLQEHIVSVCRLAFERMEPVRPVWGIGRAELAVNRRERAPHGETILGWNPENLIDEQVTALQLRRADESALATLVAYGCHPVTSTRPTTRAPSATSSARSRAANACSSRRPAATSSRRSRSPTARTRPRTWERRSASRRCTRSADGSRRRGGWPGSRRGR
jgi:hypothetical protein